MTQDVDKSHPADYEVGYKKPPRHTQFKKGQSGNPRGVRRPQSLAEAAVEVLQQPMTIVVKGRRKRVTAQHAVLLALTQSGIRGNDRAARALFALAKEAPPLQPEMSREEIGAKD